MNTPQDHLTEVAKIREKRERLTGAMAIEQRLRWARLLKKISEVLDRCWTDRTTARAGIVEIMELLEKDVTVIDEFLKAQQQEAELLKEKS